MFELISSPFFINVLSEQDKSADPPIKFGTTILEIFDSLSEKHLDMHLMIINPEKYIEKFAGLGADTITVHYEACDDLKKIIGDIKKLGVKAGLAINPDTDVSLLDHLLEEIDLVCLMSVFPGFSGQKFIPETFPRLKELKRMINEKNTNTLIQIDGGVSLDNAQELISLGADVLVAGSFVFKSDSPKETIEKLHSAIN